jgi:hypothetical protein
MLREIFEKHKNNKSPKFACSLGHKTEEACPSINSNFCGGCSQCAYYKEVKK